MKKITLALGTAALALGGTLGGIAFAQQQHAGHAMPEQRMMADPMGNATVTRAEAQTKAAEMFARLDANRDGKIDRADREAARANRIGQHFDRMDTNKDGKLDRAEFMAGHQQGARMGSMADGKHHGMRRGGGRMMGGMDANADKALSRDEFVNGALKRFDAADANKDGKLTPEERRAAMHGRMGERHGKMQMSNGAAPAKPN